MTFAEPETVLFTKWNSVVYKMATAQLLECFSGEEEEGFLLMHAHAAVMLLAEGALLEEWTDGVKETVAGSS